ncbi:MAG: hypothetical protein JEY99_17930 [Spirochaetales bacterium]|nr:hypothetical protein [Spirochaetales bacterium]
MKRILFAGDSITKGKLGCSFFVQLRKQFPHYELINLGRDGDTVSGIMARTIGHLKHDSRYDLIVLTAGHNDIILPDFNARSVAYKSIVKNLEKKGSIPAADLPEFISQYEKFISAIRSGGDVPIILTTLSCLNEDLSSPANGKRVVFNEAIRALALKNHLGLADIAQVYNTVLGAKETRDYFMDDLYESALFDTLRCRTSEGVDRLSRKRRLHLTIDGIHPNAAGAKIYSDLLSGLISRYLEETHPNKNWQEQTHPGG